VVVGAMALLGATVGWWYARRERQLYRGDVATLCNAQASSQTTLEHNRYRVEEWAQPRLRTTQARTFFARVRREAPEMAARDLRAASADLGVCPATEGYESAARRVRRQTALDKLCRELDPGILERAPRGRRVGLLLAWSHAHGIGDAIESMLGALRDAPLEQAAAELRRQLAELDVHLCTMLRGVVAPANPKPGPNVLLEIATVDDARDREVASALRARLPAIERCYAAELATSPRLTGRLNVKLRLTPEGTIDLALPQEDSTLQSAAVAGCAADEIRKIAVDAGAASATGGASFELFVVE
jgi:hypothetical protein